MKIQIVRLLLGIIGSTLSFQVLAGDLPRSFFGLETGHSRAYINTGGADSISAKDKTLRVYSGISLNESLSAEVGFVDFGEYSAHYTLNDELRRQESHAIYVSAVAVFPSDTVKWIGRVGFDWWNARYLSTSTIAGVPTYAEGSGNGHNVHYGIGLDIPLSENTSIRVNWQRYKKIGEGVTVFSQNVPSATLSGSNITLVDAGLILRF